MIVYTNKAGTVWWTNERGDAVRAFEVTRLDNGSTRIVNAKL